MEILKYLINAKFIPNNVYMTFDTSGSTCEDKMAMYKKIYDCYIKKCSEIIVVKHTTTAKWSTIEEVISRPAGGTYMSSPLRLLMEHYDHVERVTGKRPTGNLIIQLCDGDNWSEDNERFLEYVKEFSKDNLYVYYETLPSIYTTTMYYKINVLKRENPELNIRTHIFKEKKDLTTVEVEEYGASQVC